MRSMFEMGFQRNFRPMMGQFDFGSLVTTLIPELVKGGVTVYGELEKEKIAKMAKQAEQARAAAAAAAAAKAQAETKKAEAEAKKAGAAPGAPVLGMSQGTLIAGGIGIVTLLGLAILLID